MFSNRKKLCILLASMTALAWCAWAQSDLGRIVGAVHDSSGALVPGVSIKITNEGTGWSRELKSLATGDYEVPNLMAGTYAVSASHSGFANFVRSGIVLDAGRAIRVDIELAVGGVAEQVQVRETAPVVESETPAIASRLNYEMETKSPGGVGYSPWDIMVSLPTFQSGANAFVYSIGGSRGAQNDFLIDGISSPGAGSPLGSTAMTVGAAQEVQVHAVNNSAEYSQVGVYEQISRSGTNAFHGNLYYYHWNSALDARSYFAPVKPSNREHDFGAVASGPVVIPGLYNGRNRTFWTLAYDGRRNPGSRDISATVPTPAMRGGDFAAFAAIRDPLNGQPFGGNRIPSSRVSPVSGKIQDRFYPQPNFGDPNRFAALNYRVLFRAAGRSDIGDLRLDQKLSDKNTIYGRVTYDQFPVRNLEGNLFTIGTLSRLRELSASVISDTHIFNPSLINEARLGFTRSLDPSHGPLKGLDVLNEVGIQGIRAVPDAFGMPQISITGLNTLTQAQQIVNVDQELHFADSLTWIRGRHTWKFGAELRRPRPNSSSVPVGTYGALAFSGAFSGSAYADFLLGIPQESTRTFPSPPNYRRQWEGGLFVQDDFKVNRRLTVQIGLRYDRQTPTTNLRDAVYNFDPASGKVVLVSEAGRALVSPLFNPRVPIAVTDGAVFPERRLWRPDGNNFAPRIGFAFRPRASQDFAVRAGYGVFYDRIGYGVIGGQTGGPFIPGSDRFINGIVNGAPLFQFPNPFLGASAGPSTTPPSINAVIANLRNPYVQQWNATLEKAVLGTGFRWSYLGLKGTRLLVARNINVPPPSTTPFSQNRRPYPLYGDIMLTDQGGNSVYHALQVEALRRFSGLSMNLGYTWSNTISDAADGGSDVAPAMENPYNRGAERGREAYAAKHRFSGNVLWSLPLGKGHKFLPHLPAAAEYLLGGWETIGTVYLFSGGWFTPTFTGRDTSGTNVIGGRADRLANGNLANPTRDAWFDTAAFAVPAANIGRFGTSGRNVLLGPGTRVLHFGLLKSVTLRERVKLTVEMAAKNLFNHPNFGNPISNISDPNRGRITSLPSDLMYSTARRVQLRVFVSW